MGGTFNPVHLGHLRGAEEIREIFNLEEVIFIPAADPPHKSKEGIAEGFHRLEMIRRAILGNPSFSVSDTELRRRGKSYSIDTISHYRKRCADSLYFIMGEDAFSEIETWKEYPTLFSLCHFVVMTRPRAHQRSDAFHPPDGLAPFFKYDQAEEGWTHVSGKRLFLREITFLDISSTAIRERLKRGASVRYLLPPEVEAYILEKGLYRADRQGKTHPPSTGRTGIKK